MRDLDGLLVVQSCANIEYQVKCHKGMATPYMHKNVSIFLDTFSEITIHYIPLPHYYNYQVYKCLQLMIYCSILDIGH